MGAMRKLFYIVCYQCGVGRANLMVGQLETSFDCWKCNNRFKVAGDRLVKVVPKSGETE